MPCSDTLFSSMARDVRVMMRASKPRQSFHFHRITRSPSPPTVVSPTPECEVVEFDSSPPTVVSPTPEWEVIELDSSPPTVLSPPSECEDVELDSSPPAVVSPPSECEVVEWEPEVASKKKKHHRKHRWWGARKLKDTNKLPSKLQIEEMWMGRAPDVVARDEQRAAKLRKMFGFKNRQARERQEKERKEKREREKREGRKEFVYATSEELRRRYQLPDLELVERGRIEYTNWRDLFPELKTAARRRIRKGRCEDFDKLKREALARARAGVKFPLPHKRRRNQQEQGTPLDNQRRSKRQRRGDSDVKSSYMMGEYSEVVEADTMVDEYNKAVEQVNQYKNGDYSTVVDPANSSMRDYNNILYQANQCMVGEFATITDQVSQYRYMTGDHTEVVDQTNQDMDYGNPQSPVIDDRSYDLPATAAESLPVEFASMQDLPSASPQSDYSFDEAARDTINNGHNNNKDVTMSEFECKVGQQSNPLVISNNVAVPDELDLAAIETDLLFSSETYLDSEYSSHAPQSQGLSPSPLFSPIWGDIGALDSPPTSPDQEASPESPTTGEAAAESIRNSAVDLINTVADVFGCDDETRNSLMQGLSPTQTVKDSPTQTVKDSPTQALVKSPTQALAESPTQALAESPTQTSARPLVEEGEGATATETRKRSRKAKRRREFEKLVVDLRQIREACKREDSALATLEELNVDKKELLRRIKDKREKLRKLRAEEGGAKSRTEKESLRAEEGRPESPTEEESQEDGRLELESTADERQLETEVLEEREGKSQRETEQDSSSDVSVDGDPQGVSGKPCWEYARSSSSTSTACDKISELDKRKAELLKQLLTIQRV